MKKVILFLILAGILASVAWAGGELLAAKDIKDKFFYTRVNIYYENPLNIQSTNYLKGHMLPAGSHVRIVDINAYQVVFMNDSRITFTVKLNSWHTKVDMAGLFERLFSESDPLGPDGLFRTFTADEQENIQKGLVQRGMSKPAVLMSYGYPPDSSTPSLNMGMWTYWHARFDKDLLFFEGDRLSGIQD